MKKHLIRMVILISVEMKELTLNGSKRFSLRFQQNTTIYGIFQWAHVKPIN